VKEESRSAIDQIDNSSFTGDRTDPKMAVTIDDVRALTAGLPRSYEVFVHGRVKFRVGQIVYLAFSRDETLMGFAFPKEEREAALETYPDKFVRPKPTEMRFRWLVVRLDAIDEHELRELVFDAWRMVVPKKLSVLSDEELQQRAAS
jgi:hypothetical protein